MTMSRKSLEILKYCIKKNDDILLEELIQENKLYNLNNEQYNMLREIVCDELIKEGFEQEEITQYGIDLEALIDELGRFVI